MKCRKCGEKLEITLMNTEFEGMTYYDSVLGVCPRCHHKYIWTEVFEHTGSEDFQDITHDPDFED